MGLVDGSQGGPDPAVHRGARRAYPRHQAHGSVELLAPVTASGIVINLSSGGVRVALTRGLPVGAACRARIHTETGGELLVDARVVWCQSRVDGCVMGLAFQRHGQRDVHVIWLGGPPK